MQLLSPTPPTVRAVGAWLARADAGLARAAAANAAVAVIDEQRRRAEWVSQERSATAFALPVQRRA